jgi:phosphohistidine phosphatase SixA
MAPGCCHDETDRDGTMVTGVVVVRHARAGSKRRWSGPDLLRPLDSVGERHAIDLVDRLATIPVRRLISSPALRCVQTLEPLAHHTGLTIERCELLGPDGDGRAVLGLPAEEALRDAVLCTHGEVMRPMLRQMRRRDVTILGEPGPRGWLLRKGTAWQLTIADGGRITELRGYPPLG